MHRSYDADRIWAANRRKDAVGLRQNKLPLAEIRVYDHPPSDPICEQFSFARA
jgi:hypothetical protein